MLELLNLTAYLFVNLFIYFKGISIAKQQNHQSIWTTKTDHSSPGPPKDYIPILSHPIEPYPTDLISFDSKTTLNRNIVSYFVNILLPTTRINGATQVGQLPRQLII